MNLSDQIANSCCGVLANKQEMYDKAVRMELQLVTYKNTIKDMDDEIKNLQETINVLQSN